MQIRAARGMRKQTSTKEKLEKIRKDLEGKAKLFNFKGSSCIRNLYWH